MQITCQNCSQELTLPDDKVPAGSFAVTCPSCKKRIEVNPEPVEPAVAAAAEPVEEVRFEPVPPVREHDKELFDNLYPVAGVVNLAGRPVQHLEDGLALLGINEVHHFDDMEAATEAMLESDFSMLLVLLDKATAPPFEPLEALYSLPLSVRRGVFVALLADNVRSLDGQTAFYLQVNCLISTQELPKSPAYLRQALTFHLRHYRFWGVRE